MENITNFYETAPLMLAIYWSVAALSSILFLVQAIILLIGFDTDSDFSGGDAAFDADGMNLVSFKTILCFLLGFGWTGAIFYPIFENKLTVALIAVAAGVSFMFLIAFLLRQPRHDPKHIAVHSGCPLIEADGCDGTGGVFADPRKCQNFRHCTGKTGRSESDRRC